MVKTQVFFMKNKKNVKKYVDVKRHSLLGDKTLPVKFTP